MKSENIEQLSKLIDLGEVSPQVKLRRRSPTLLKLQWLAERVRKVERIKGEVAAGTYRVDSQLVAKSILTFSHNVDLDSSIESEND